MIMVPDPSIVRAPALSFDFKQQTSALYLPKRGKKVGGGMKSLMRMICGRFYFWIRSIDRLRKSFQVLAVASPQLRSSGNHCCGGAENISGRRSRNIWRNEKTRDDHANLVANLIDYFEIWDPRKQPRDHQANGRFGIAQEVVDASTALNCFISLGPGNELNLMFRMFWGHGEWSDRFCMQRAVPCSQRRSGKRTLIYSNRSPS